MQNNVDESQKSYAKWKKKPYQKGTNHMMYLKYTVWWEIKVIKQVNSQF